MFMIDKGLYDCMLAANPTVCVVQHPHHEKSVLLGIHSQQVQEQQRLHDCMLGETPAVRVMQHLQYHEERHAVINHALHALMTNRGVKGGCLHRWMPSAGLLWRYRSDRCASLLWQEPG